MPIKICRCGANEGGEENVGATGVIAGLLEGLGHHGVDGVDDSGLARACTSIGVERAWTAAVARPFSA